MQTASTQLAGALLLPLSRVEKLHESNFPAEECNAAGLPLPVLLPWEMKWLKGMKLRVDSGSKPVFWGPVAFSFLCFTGIYGDFFHGEGIGKSALSSLLDMCSQCCLISRLWHNVAIKAFPLGSPCSVAYFWP